MEIEDYIEKIIKDGDINEMEKLSEILEDVLEVLEEYDEEIYKKYEMCLYKMAYGNVLTKEMAEEIVSKMKPFGKKWSLEETKRVQEQFGLDNIRPVDFFIVLNSKFNDDRDTVEKFTHNPEEELDMYVSLTRDFIMDEDAKPDKIFLYYTVVPQ